MRRARLATTSILVDDLLGYPSPCIGRCLAMIDRAGQAGADIVLCPEEPDVVGCEEGRTGDLPERRVRVVTQIDKARFTDILLRIQKL